MSHVVVVGAGLAGLSAAMHIRAAGHDVTVIEQEPVAGGRLGLLIEHGTAGSYRLDTGPSTFGMPALVSECFAALDTPMADYLELVDTRPGLVAHFPDGSQLRVDHDPDVLAERVADLCCEADGEGIARFVRDLTATVRGLREALDRPAADSPAGFARRAWHRVDVARRSPHIQDYVRDPRLHKLYRWSPVPGRSPDTPHGVLGCYSDLVAPAWFPRGGMFRLPASMAAAADTAGVRLHYRTLVTGTRMQQRRVTAVVTADGEIGCDLLVLTTTRPAAFRLLDTDGRSRGPFAPSAWMLLVGGNLSGPLPAAHRRVIFGRDDQMGDLVMGRLPRDPTLLISQPGVTDTSLAPRGRATATVMAPAPHLGHYPAPLRPADAPLIATSQDWGRIGGHYRKHIAKMLRSNGFGGLDSADVEHVLTPVDWLARGLDHGTPFGMHQLSRSNQWGDNVVLAGAALGQGSDITQALLSGMQAADRVTTGRRPRPDWTATPL